MTKVDVYKEHAAEYVTPKSPALVEVGPARYLAIEGRGDPNGEAFQEAMGALYGVAFTTKMASKRKGRDYVVAKLEAQWWLDSGVDYQNAPRETWNWRAMIRTPDFITAAEVQAAVEALRTKGKDAAVERVKLMPIKEGLCVQVLHTGPYSEEPATIGRMHAFAQAGSYAFHGLHHELYLSDPRRTEPSKLRTILRMPVRK